jgi:hypothetical protein
MLFNISIYGNTGEVTICPKGNIPLGYDDPSWQQRLFRVVRPRAQDKLIFEAKHCSTGLSPANNVTWNASALELRIRVDEK